MIFADPLILMAACAAVVNWRNPMETFLFALDSCVRICVSNERGVVIGRAQYSASQNAYLIRYKANDGRAVEAWWNEDALEQDE